MTASRQLSYWLVGLALLLICLYLLREILMPFVAGMAIAYFLDPLCDRLERWGMSRLWATSLVTVLAALLFLLLLGLMLPAIVGQLASLIVKLPDLLEGLRNYLGGVISLLEARIDPALVEKVKGGLAGSIGNLAAILGGAAGGVLSGGLAVANLLSLLFLTPVVAFFLLRDWDKLVAMIDGWLPRRHAETIRTLVREADGILADFTRGVGTVCLILATFYGLSLTVIGLESGLVVGLVAGMLSFIPFVGAIGGFVLGVGLALMQFDGYLPVVAVAAVFVLGQVAEGNFLTPKLVGDRVGLHPVMVIFALLAGGALFGFTGVILAIPVAAVVGVLARFGLERYLASPLYGGESGQSPRGSQSKAEERR